MVKVQNCKHCGQEYKPNPIGRKSVYCSKQCNYDVQNKKKSEAIKSKIKPLECKACGKQFLPCRAGSGLKYCSRECKNRATGFKKKYGTTVSEYNALFEQQNGRCEICGIHQSELDKTLHLDHCHKTREIRGLLCSVCNLGLGQFRDDTEVIERAIEFLEGAQTHE